MATHFSTLAWKIPWTEEPGRLQSMGSLRVRHDWATSLSLFTFMHWRRKWQPTPVFLPGQSQGQGSLVDCRLWGRTELDTTEATRQQQQIFLSLAFPFPLSTSLPFVFVYFSRTVYSSYIYYFPYGFLSLFFHLYYISVWPFPDLGVISFLQFPSLGWLSSSLLKITSHNTCGFSFPGDKLWNKDMSECKLFVWELAPRSTCRGME